MNGGREAQLANPGARDPGRPSEPRAPEPAPFQQLTRGRGAGGGGGPDDRPALLGRELPASGPGTRDAGSSGAAGQRSAMAPGSRPAQ